MKNAAAVLVTAVSVLTLAGCGGGGGGSVTAGGGGSSLKAADVYPTTVALASPTSLQASTATVVAAADVPVLQRWSTWWSQVSDGLQQGNRALLLASLRSLLPFSEAVAAPVLKPEAMRLSDYLASVAAGTAIPTADTLPLANMFMNYQAASCYGPRLKYENHDNAVPPAASSGELPGGDLGMWRSMEDASTPCSVAQLNALMKPVKSRANASLILGARLTALALAHGGMPAVGSSKDLKTEFASFVSSVLPAGATLEETMAGITAESDGSYTYQVRLKFNNNRVVAFKLNHKKGSGSGFSGLLQYASSNMVRAASTNYCNGQKTADVGTLRYSSDGTTLQFSAREGPYCIVDTDEVVTNFPSYVALTTDGELDPAQNTSSNTRGWDQEGGGFKRFAASLTTSDHAGNYLFAWQAGVNDSHSRMFAAKVGYDASETRGVKAFFGYADKMGEASATNRGKLLGMICNWAGPGTSNAHTPLSLVQRQSTSMAASATTWAAPTDNLVYAPTDTCNASATMRYDVNMDNTVAAGEGSGVSHSLLVPGAGRTVAQELSDQGFTPPAYY